VDDALVDRYPGTEREDEDRDDEAPEVEFAAVSEGVIFVGRLARLAAPPHQKQLIGRIDDAVDTLGQHRRRAGDRRRGEL
jgi:hypothetical protein